MRLSSIWSYAPILGLSLVSNVHALTTMQQAGMRVIYSYSGLVSTSTL